MDPFTLSALVLGMISAALQGAQKAGLVGNPDWIRYLEAGLFVAKQATNLLKDMKLNPTRYDHLTPDEIRMLLMPDDWAALELEVEAEEAGGAPA